MSSALIVRGLSLLAGFSLGATHAQETTPSRPPDEPPRPPLAAEEIAARLLRLKPLQVDSGGNTLFLGAVTRAEQTGTRFEYSLDLKEWHTAFLAWTAAEPPPPPPISLLDSLERLPNLNLRVVPLRMPVAPEQYFRLRYDPLERIGPSAKDDGS